MMPLTIEGAHIFGGTALDEATVLGRIDFIKKEWDHPLFFITFSHHFDNGLCGHAHSLPEVATFVLNQEKAMNEGFTALGWKVIRKLLAIDENNDPAPKEVNETRDFKRMPGAGRRWAATMVSFATRPDIAAITTV